MSNVFGASSRQFQRRNQDGSINIHCYSCGQFIAKTFQGPSRALCAMCDRVEKGESLDEESIKQYMAQKAANVDIGMLLVSEEPPTAPGRRKSVLANAAGEVIAALGKFALGRKPGVEADTPDAPKPASAKIATEKRRKRLFTNVDLGTMDQVDAKLKEPPK